MAARNVLLFALAAAAAVPSNGQGIGVVSFASVVGKPSLCVADACARAGYNSAYDGLGASFSLANFDPTRKK